eukprot:scaffold37132_cov57-Phaeocystis_antarctica.AAC.2
MLAGVRGGACLDCHRHAALLCCPRVAPRVVVSCAPPEMRGPDVTELSATDVVQPLELPPAHAHLASSLS